MNNHNLRLWPVALLGFLLCAPYFTGAAAADSKALKPGPDSGMLPITEGPFKPDWASLHQYQTPEWFQNAKFGIWAHWTAQCVPERGDWYARSMYQEYQYDDAKKALKLGADGKPIKNGNWKFHQEHYGPQSKFGFKDIDHIWTVDKWEPAKLIDLYKRAGAKYFVALANHHDNFDCYDSTYQPWNSVNIGPKRDIVGEWAKATRAAGLHFGVTVHAARTWNWFDVSHKADVDGPFANIPYDGNLTKAEGKGQWWEGYDPAELYGPAPALRTPENHLAYNVKFYNRTIDLVHKYKPDLLYFDDWRLPLFGDSQEYGLKIAADLYNTSIQANGKNEAVMNTKSLKEDERHCLVLDIERGKSDTIDSIAWQTDTCIGGWHYSRGLFDRHGYKTPAQVIGLLVDIVSKNGNLLLNVPLKGDGTIDSDEQACMEGIASWMAVNPEGIFDTRPWKIYGEGPSTLNLEKGQFGGSKDVASKPFTKEDFRFTAKDKVVYAFAMAASPGTLKIKSLGLNSPEAVKVGSVQLIGGSGSLKWEQAADALIVEGPQKMPSDYVSVYKVTLN